MGSYYSSEETQIYKLWFKKTLFVFYYGFFLNSVYLFIYTDTVHYLFVNILTLYNIFFIFYLIIKVLCIYFTLIGLALCSTKVCTNLYLFIYLFF